MAHGQVVRAPRLGGPAEVLAGAITPTGIALDAACVYWVDSADGSVWKAPK